MSRGPDGPAAFLDQLLAPLPDRERPAADPRFAAELRRDQARADRAAWRRARAAVVGWNQLLQGARAIRLVDRPERRADWRGREDIAETRLREAIAAMMAVPAPNLEALRFKRRWLRPFGGRRNPAFLAAIEADSLRLGAAARI